MQDEEKDTKVVINGTVESDKPPIGYSEFENSIKIGAMNNTKL